MLLDTILIQECTVPATYGEMWAWIIAAIIFYVADIAIFFFVKEKIAKIIGCLGTTFWAIILTFIAYAAYIEASGQMTM